MHGTIAADAVWALLGGAFLARVTQATCVAKYQMARFDRNRYSVPRTCAFRSVTVKGYVGRVEVVADRRVVARHARSYGHDVQILDPLHYPATLERRPAALDHAPALKDWQLPEPFARLRRALAAGHGPHAGARQYIRVLQLLGEHPPAVVQRAVEQTLVQGEVRAERIAAPAGRLSGAGRSAPEVPKGSHSGTGSPDEYQVPRPDLSLFDEHLDDGGQHDEGQ